MLWLAQLEPLLRCWIGVAGIITLYDALRSAVFGLATSGWSSRTRAALAAASCGLVGARKALWDNPTAGAGAFRDVKRDRR